MFATIAMWHINGDGITARSSPLIPTKAPSVASRAVFWIRTTELTGGLGCSRLARRRSYCVAWSRRTRLRIFPEADFGIASTNVSLRTCL